MPLCHTIFYPERCLRFAYLAECKNLKLAHCVDKHSPLSFSVHTAICVSFLTKFFTSITLLLLLAKHLAQMCFSITLADLQTFIKFLSLVVNPATHSVNIWCHSTPVEILYKSSHFTRRCRRKWEWVFFSEHPKWHSVSKEAAI